MSVDFDAPDPAPAAPVAAAVEPVAPEPVPEPPADPDEAQAVEIQGGKHVPLAALKSVREENRLLKEQANRVSQLEQTIAQQQGQLTTFQQLSQTLQRPAAPQGPTPDDPYLVELAQSLDYMVADGKGGFRPDVDRAAKHAALIERQAQKIAAAQIAPYQQQSARAQSIANYQAVRNLDFGGVKPSQESIDWMWQNLGVEYTSNPQVAQGLAMLGLGLDAARKGTTNRLPPNPAPPANPPLHTEGLAGGPARRSAPITEAERQVLNSRGMKEDTYLKHTKDFQKGRPTVLEDD